MTAAQMYAKNWLFRLKDYEDILKSEKNTLEMLEARLYRGVSNYGGYTGRSDYIVAQAAHDDAIIALSLQADRVEITQRAYLNELEKTRAVIRQIPLHLQAMITDKYINCLNEREMEKRYNYGKSQLYRYLREALTAIAEVLNAEQISITPKKEKEQATA